MTEPAKTSRTATCNCGAVRVTVEGEPVRVSVCHCLACQTRTGSVFGVQSRWRDEDVRAIEGTSKEWVRIGDSGSRVTFHFCPTCGSTVYWRLDTIPGFLVVAVGAFADPTFPAPAVGVYAARQHAWVRACDWGALHVD